MPVLSKQMVDTLEKCSRMSVLRIRIPAFMAKFIVIDTTEGIARPKAQGLIVR